MRFCFFLLVSSLWFISHIEGQGLFAKWREQAQARKAAREGQSSRSIFTSPNQAAQSGPWPPHYHSRSGKTTYPHEHGGQVFPHTHRGYPQSQSYSQVQSQTNDNDRLLFRQPDEPPPQQQQATIGSRRPVVRQGYTGPLDQRCRQSTPSQLELVFASRGPETLRSSWEMHTARGLIFKQLNSCRAKKHYYINQIARDHFRVADTLSPWARQRQGRRYTDSVETFRRQGNTACQNAITQSQLACQALETGVCSYTYVSPPVTEKDALDRAATLVEKVKSAQEAERVCNGVATVFRNENVARTIANKPVLRQQTVDCWNGILDQCFIDFYGNRQAIRSGKPTSLRNDLKPFQIRPTR